MKYQEKCVKTTTHWINPSLCVGIYPARIARFVIAGRERKQTHNSGLVYCQKQVGKSGPETPRCISRKITPSVDCWLIGELPETVTCSYSSSFSIPPTARLSVFSVTMPSRMTPYFRLRPVSSPEQVVDFHLNPPHVGQRVAADAERSTGPGHCP